MAITALFGVAAILGIWRLSKELNRRHAKSVRESDEMWAKALDEMDGGTGALDAWRSKDRGDE